MATQQLSTRCCIVGGGPCGLMLGFLLARAGVDVVVLEKHADFFRDFRGDTIHPSTLEVMSELGLFDQFLKLPHQKAPTISAFFGGREYAFADFTHLPTRAKFIALMPQWDFLNFIAEQGKSYPTFHLRTRADAVDLIEEGGRVAGVRANTPDGTLEVRADLTVGMRRPPLDRARARRARGRGARRADGRAVVPAAEKGQRPRRDHGPLRRRAHRHPDRPRRLLAMRLPDPQGRDRGDQARRSAGVPAERRANSCRRSRTASTSSRTGTRSSS